MAKGVETFAQHWSGNENYLTSVTADNATSIGFIWSFVGSLDLSTNILTSNIDVTPYYGVVAVLVVDTVIGAALSNPAITMKYIDKDGATRITGVQLLPGMPELTSISIPLPNGFAVILNLSTNVTVSGTISIRSARSTAEEFDLVSGITTVWPGATPGL